MIRSASVAEWRSMRRAARKLKGGGTVGPRYVLEGWGVSTTTVLADMTSRNVQLGIEVLAVDRELARVRERLDRLEGARQVEFRYALSMMAGYIAYEYMPQRFKVAGDESELREALERIPVPMFGSPPANWEPLERLLTTAGPFGTATVIMQQTGQKVSLPVLILFGTGITVIVNVLHPATKAFGEVIANRIRRWGLLDKDAELE
jgi:hypothetical protein